MRSLSVDFAKGSSHLPWAQPLHAPWFLGRVSDVTDGQNARFIPKKNGFCQIPPVIWLNYIEYVALADPWMVYGWFIGLFFGHCSG